MQAAPKQPSSTGHSTWGRHRDTAPAQLWNWKVPVTLCLLLILEITSACRGAAGQTPGRPGQLLGVGMRRFIPAPPHGDSARVGSATHGTGAALQGALPWEG